jgi:hypothetical protein
MIKLIHFNSRKAKIARLLEESQTGLKVRKTLKGRWILLIMSTCLIGTPQHSDNRGTAK